MSGFGTDLAALACILGGAAVGGGLTMAFLDGSDGAQVGCAVETMAMGQRIIVTRGEGAHSVVLSVPHQRLHAPHDCGAVVVGEMPAHLMELRREVEEARVRVDISRAQMGEARTMVRQLREAARDLQAAGEEARMEEVRVILEKVEKGSGGQLH